MQITGIAQEIISSAFGTVLGGLILSLLAWLIWPFRWKIQGRAIQRLIANQRRFNFVFNPGKHMTKEVTFLPDGLIGEGRNDNEQAWRIRKGCLEILALDGNVYSRFRFDHTQGRFKHTNDPDLRSIPGQYMEPRLVKIVR